MRAQRHRLSQAPDRDGLHLQLLRHQHGVSVRVRARTPSALTWTISPAAFVRLEGGIILDFRIAWAMHLDTPGDTIIMGTKGSSAHPLHRLLERHGRRPHDASTTTSPARRRRPPSRSSRPRARGLFDQQDPLLPGCGQERHARARSDQPDPQQSGYPRRHREVRRCRQGSRHRYA